MKFRILDPNWLREKYRLDAAETVFFERELQHVYAQTYDVRYPELKGRMFIPVSNQAGGGATSVNYRQFDRVGKAKIIGQKARDLPRVDIFGKEFIRPVRIIGASYGYDLMEMRQAAMANRPLNAARGSAARRVIEELLEEVACFGSPDDGITDGFLNNPNVDVTAAGGAWSGLTADQIITEVRLQFQRIADNTKGIEQPDTLLLPTSANIEIATKPRSTNSDKTVKQFLLENFPNLMRIEPWWRLDTAGAGGITRAVLYNSAADHLVQEIPSEFEQLPVQEQGLEFLVPCLATTAGTSLMYPKSVDFVDGL